MNLVLVVSVLLVISASVTTAVQVDFEEKPYGLQILGKIFRQYLNSQPEDILLGDGVHLISKRSENDARAFNEDNSVLGAMEDYLESHEIRIRLPELMPNEGIGRAFKNAMSNNKDPSSPRQGGGGGGGGGGKGGGGGGGGGGGLMLLGALWAKLLATLSIGGVGFLAMKALMVSALALTLSLIIGVKKLVHHDHDEGGHTVIHASPHGHGYGHEYRRKKREALERAYEGWLDIKNR